MDEFVKVLDENCLDFGGNCLDFGGNCLDFGGNCLDFGGNCLDFGWILFYKRAYADHNVKNITTNLTKIFFSFIRGGGSRFSFFLVYL